MDEGYSVYYEGMTTTTWILQYGGQDKKYTSVDQLGDFLDHVCVIIFMVKCQVSRGIPFHQG